MTGADVKVAEIFESMAYGPAPEDAGPAFRWLDQHGRTFRLFIGGAWVGAQSGESFEIIDPATGRSLARAAQGGAADVDAAVRAARDALPGWHALGGHGRARYLCALARQIEKHARLFAVLESLDSGKPIRESRDVDIPLAARHFYHHAGWAQLAEIEFRDHAPVGVVGQIIPWNSPLLMLARKLAPALAVGNTVVLKPAEHTPLTALRFAELCHEIGLPAGVVNIVTGDGRTGELIVRHPGIDKIAFTGSAEVGRSIRMATAGSGKRLSLELGGNSLFIVFEDADLDSAVEGVVDAICQGELCCAGCRILAQESIAEALARKLRARMEKLRIGDPLDRTTDVGAVAAPALLEAIHRLVRQGVEEGATLWQPSWSCPTEGYFFPPTLFTDVAPASTIAQAEIAGPVVALMTFRTPEEAVELVNDARCGIAASVWTENIDLALDVACKLTAGMVWINSASLFDAATGFGGCPESGFGGEGGREGLREYLRPAWQTDAVAPTDAVVSPPSTSAGRAGSPATPPIARTARLYIGGKQRRPGSASSLPVLDHEGRRLGEVGLGSREDIRNAVEAAHRAAGWARTTAHDRARILYDIAENLAARADEFAHRIALMTGRGREAARHEVERSIRRLFAAAAWADKWEGASRQTIPGSLTIAVREPVGVIGIVCPDEPALLPFVSAVFPAVATGNTVVVIPSGRWPLAATDFYQVLDSSDLPDGVVNIVTGCHDELAEALAAHNAVDAIWYFGSAEGSAAVERLSAGNLKCTWVDYGRARDWFDPRQGEGHEFLRKATRIKKIWIPYGE